MQLNPEHIPTPPPLTDDEWATLFIAVGYLGGISESDLTEEGRVAGKVATQSLKILEKLTSPEYVEHFIVPRLAYFCEHPEEFKGLLP